MELTGELKKKVENAESSDQVKILHRRLLKLFFMHVFFSYRQDTLRSTEEEHHTACGA